MNIKTTTIQIISLFIILINSAMYSQNVFPVSNYVSLEKGNSFSKTITLQAGNGDYTWNINGGIGLTTNSTYGTLSNYQSTNITIAGSNNYNTSFTQTYFFSVTFQNKATYNITTRSFNITVYYLLGCQDEIIITQNINSGETDNQSAQSIISATNTVNNGAISNYDAGTIVYLKPTFHAKSGATFKAFIEGCSSSSSKSSEIIEKTEIIRLKKDVDVLEGNEIRIFPNPTTGNVTISTPEMITSYVLYNSFGSRLISQQVATNTVSVSIQNQPSGMYFIHITLSSGAIVIKKIIKK